MKFRILIFLTLILQVSVLPWFLPNSFSPDIVIFLVGIFYLGHAIKAYDVFIFITLLQILTLGSTLYSLAIITSIIVLKIAMAPLLSQENLPQKTIIFGAGIVTLGLDVFRAKDFLLLPIATHIALGIIVLFGIGWWATEVSYKKHA